MNALFKVSGVTVRYGRVEAVRDVSLSVAQGSIATVIGANGAGKTTLLAALMGLLPHDGRVEFDGQDLTRVPIEERVALDHDDFGLNQSKIINSDLVLTFRAG